MRIFEIDFFDNDYLLYSKLRIYVEFQKYLFFQNEKNLGINIKNNKLEWIQFFFFEVIVLRSRETTSTTNATINYD